MSGSVEGVEDLRKMLVASVEKAFSLRQTLRVLAGQDSTTASPQDLHDRLLESRKVVDALEHELVLVLLAKSRADRLKADCAAAVEDAEVEKAGPSTKGEFVTAGDRSIDINTRTLSQRRQLRQADVLATEAAATLRAIQEMHRGADGYRREIDFRLRAINLTNALER